MLITIISCNNSGSKSDSVGWNRFAMEQHRDWLRQRAAQVALFGTDAAAAGQNRQENQWPLVVGSNFSNTLHQHYHVQSDQPHRASGRSKLEDLNGAFEAALARFADKPLIDAKLLRLNVVIIADLALAQPPMK